MLSGESVQVVKVVETGVAEGAEGDAKRALRLAGGGAEGVRLSSGVGAARGWNPKGVSRRTTRGRLGEPPLPAGRGTARVDVHTLFSFGRALAPAAAAAAEGREVALGNFVAAVRALPERDWRIFEGAGGVATPIDGAGRDWADFAGEAGVDAIVVVVPDRLGAINQARLACLRAAAAGVPFGVWLNETAPVEAGVAASNRDGLAAAGVPIWADQRHGAGLPAAPERVLALLRQVAPDCVGPQNVDKGSPLGLGAGTARRAVRVRSGGPTPPTGMVDPLSARCVAALGERKERNLLRRLRVAMPAPGILNLADNDYLELARDPEVVAAAAAAAGKAASASASPLITGWREEHERLVRALCERHGFAHGMLWTSGYAANSAVLGALPRGGDIALADRLVHHSMIAGLLRSGARVQRYPHLDLGRMEAWLSAAATDASATLPDRQSGNAPAAPSPLAVSDRVAFVVTESVFSMDGDYPDLARLADLKRRLGFRLVLDEAHALGWYGPEGSGMARASGETAAVDVFVGTLGKALASGGAYTLFHDEALRDYLVNFAGEFIYSTMIPPANAAAALAALERMRALSGDQAQWHASSRSFRAELRADGWRAPEGESPIVPVRLDGEGAALSLGEALRAEGILAAAVRPPTVPAGTSRIRFSLKRSFGQAESRRVLAAMAGWRKGG
jgi:8-amino-7-oxononanoate synthase